MTEAEWQACEDAKEMLLWLWLGERPGERKERLLACACCRRVWHLLADPRSRSAVKEAELCAEGQPWGERMAAVYHEAVNAVYDAEAAAHAATRKSGGWSQAYFAARAALR